MNGDTIGVPISFEYLLTRLFGKRSYHGFSDVHSFKRWKKPIVKLFGAIRKTILINVDTTDMLHKSRLLRSCDEAISEITSAEVKVINQINVSAIEHLTEIVFELMGRMPDHRDYKVINRPEHWGLNTYRKLNYTQTNNQKASLIFDLVLEHQLYGKLNYKELWNKMYYDFDNNSDEFIKWFKQTYTDLYLQVF